MHERHPGAGHRRPPARAGPGRPRATAGRARRRRRRAPGRSSSRSARPAGPGRRRRRASAGQHLGAERVEDGRHRAGGEREAEQPRRVRAARPPGRARSPGRRGRSPTRLASIQARSGPSAHAIDAADHAASAGHRRRAPAALGHDRSAGRPPREQDRDGGEGRAERRARRRRRWCPRPPIPSPKSMPPSAQASPPPSPRPRSRRSRRPSAAPGARRSGLSTLGAAATIRGALGASAPRPRHRVDALLRRPAWVLSIILLALLVTDGRGARRRPGRPGGRAG